ncbi:MAG TPA: MaoC family dehydratase [Dehalococcoidia bacterium]|nr:MaoC family dehydratase [Dehalococcoidia bacterium]
MAEGLSGIEKLKGRLGVDWLAREYQIERGMIERFTRAVGDANPRWQEGMVAPPAFILSIGFEHFVDGLMSLAPFKTVLMGNTEIECYQPVGAGDVITVVFKIGSLREREGSMGNMAFMTFDSSYKNQEKKLVAKCRQMIIGY